MSTVADAPVRCAKCGTLQPATLDFCTTRIDGELCLTYLGWSRQPGAPEPATPVAVPGPSVQMAVASEGFDRPGPDAPLVVSVMPGDRVGLQVTLRNTGRRVDWFGVTIEGLPYGWVDAVAASLHLVPIGHPEGTSEGMLEFSLRPPRDSSAVAGAYAITIGVHSKSDGRLIANERATLIVRRFYAVTATARPHIARGRTKVSYWVDVRNGGNVAITPALLPTDGDKLEFVTPSGLTAIAPGDAAALPLHVRAPRRVIGQPLDHQLQIAVLVHELDPPLPPLPAIFRQKPLIAWWVPVALALALALAIALYAVWPHKVTMPPVQGMSTVFRAERALQKAGLKGKPQVFTRVLSTVKQGTVLDQNPRPFARVDPDVPIVLRVAVPATFTIIPNLVGMTVGEAEEDLTRRYLKLGKVVPAGAEATRKIASQVPLPGRARGRDVTAVDVVLEPPGKVVVPKIVCMTLGQAEKALTAKGFKLGTPEPGVTSSEQATSQVPDAHSKRPVGTTVTPMGFEQSPSSCTDAGGTGSQAPGSSTGSTTTPGVVTASGQAIASAGPPVAFDDGDTVLMTSSITPLSAGAQPAWSPDAKLLAVREDAGIRVSPPGAPATGPATVRLRRWVASAPAFAPGHGADPLLAFLAGRAGASSRLCFARVTKGALEPGCLTLPRLVARSIAWSPGGTVILVVGARPGDAARPGVMRVRLAGGAPARAGSWSVDRLLWHVRLDGRVGPVFDVAYDPASPRLAVITNLAAGGRTGEPRVALMNLSRWPVLDDADWIGAAACQVAWNPSGSRLAVVDSGGAKSCPAERRPGRLRSIAAGAPARPTTLSARARNPAWQP